LFIDPTRSFNRILSPDCLFQCHRNGSHLQVLYARNVTPFVSRLKNKRVINFSFSIFLSLSISLSWTLVLDGFRSWWWFVDVPHRCSLKPSLVAPRGRSCPYSASPVVTGHPEELHQQEQFRVLVYRAVYFVLFVRVSKPSYIRPLVNQRYLFST